MHKPQRPIPFPNPTPRQVRQDRIWRDIQATGRADPKDLAEEEADALRYRLQLAQERRRKRREVESEFARPVMPEQPEPEKSEELQRAQQTSLELAKDASESMRDAPTPSQSVNRPVTPLLEFSSQPETRGRVRCTWFKIRWQISEHKFRSILITIPTVAWALFLGIAGLVQNDSGKPLYQWLQDNGLPTLMTLLLIGLGTVVFLVVLAVAIIVIPANSELEAIKPHFEKLTPEQRALLSWLLPLGQSPVDMPQTDRDNLEYVSRVTPFISRVDARYLVNKDTASRVALLLKCDEVKRKFWYETAENELTGSGSQSQPKELNTPSKPQPNIVLLGWRKVLVERDSNFVFREVLNSSKAQWAIVVDFQNKLELGREIKGIRDVLSHLTFTNATGELSYLIKRGFWLEQASPRAVFERGDTRSLFISRIEETLAGTFIMTFENKDDDEGRIHSPPINFSPEDSISVTITIFTQTRHRLHKECELQLSPEIVFKRPLT
jgi:hypothetical protein